MRRKITIVLVLLVVSLAAGVRAQTAYEIEDTFYDCALNEVGWRFLACNGSVNTWGQQSGAYRYRYRYACDGSGSSTQWAYYNGTTFVAFPGPPGPNC